MDKYTKTLLFGLIIVVITIGVGVYFVEQRIAEIERPQNIIGKVTDVAYRGYVTHQAIIVFNNTETTIVFYDSLYYQKVFGKFEEAPVFEVDDWVNVTYHQSWGSGSGTFYADSVEVIELPRELMNSITTNENGETTLTIPSEEAILEYMATLTEKKENE